MSQVHIYARVSQFVHNTKFDPKALLKGLKMTCSSVVSVDVVDKWNSEVGYLGDKKVFMVECYISESKKVVELLQGAGHDVMFVW